MLYAYSAVPPVTAIRLKAVQCGLSVPTLVRYQARVCTGLSERHVPGDARVPDLSAQSGRADLEGLVSLGAVRPDLIGWRVGDRGATPVATAG